MIPAIYKLQPIVDDPRYEGFGTSQRSLLGNTTFAQDFLPEDDGHAKSLKRIWRPVKVEGRVREFNDYPCINLLIPAFSERAVKALRNILEENGELLPLSSKLRKYFAYNVTTIADVLDGRKSTVEYYPDSRRAMWIERYEFRASKLKSLSIFAIPDDPGQLYVTDVFRAAVETAGLDGFDFVKVWPLGKGEDWQSLHKRQAKQRRNKGLPKGQQLKGQSVFVRLKLKADRPSRDECKLRDRLMDELDAMLVDPAGRKIVGSMEGHECINGVCELRISCPDADTLARFLLPWLKKMQWPNSMTVVKRNASFDSVKAVEKSVKLSRQSRG